MTPRFDAWMAKLAEQDQLFLNLAIIILAIWSIWFLHLRKSRHLQIAFWIGIYSVYFSTLVYCYFARSALP